MRLSPLLWILILFRVSVLQGTVLHSVALSHLLKDILLCGFPAFIIICQFLKAPKFYQKHFSPYFVTFIIKQSQ